MLIAACGFLLLPVGDTISKLLGEDGMAPVQIAWARWAIQTVLLTPLVLALYGRATYLPARPGLLVARGLAVVAATVCYFSAIRVIPLADAAGVLFVAPLLVTALSAAALGERVGPRRWAAVAVGFAGMLLIVKPGTSAMQWGALWALGAAFLFAAYMVLTRRTAGLNAPLVTLWWAGAVGTVLLSALAVPVWRPPTPLEWAMLGLLGVLGALAHLLIIWAAERVEASAMAPLPYLEIVMAAALGYLVFGDLPDAFTWAGCALVVGAGLFVVLRERRAPAGAPARGGHGPAA